MRLRKAARRDWSAKKEQAFLATLADTCNVREACRAAKVSDTTAYRRRKDDAAFRAAWLAAIATAYQRLELVLLDRAFNGTPKMVREKDGSERQMLEYSNQLGLALLKMHRDSAAAADTEFEPDDIEALRDKLIRKFQRLKHRDAGKGPAE